MVEVPETTGAVRRAKLQSFRRHQQTEDCTTLDAIFTYRCDYTLQVILRRQDGETRPAGRDGAYGLTLTGGRPCTVGGVKPGGLALRAGLRPGDVVCRVNGHCVVAASTDNVARILRYVHRLSPFSDHFVK